MTTPIICRTHRQPASVCKCFRCRPAINAKPARKGGEEKKL